MKPVARKNAPQAIRSCGPKRRARLVMVGATSMSIEKFRPNEGVVLGFGGRKEVEFEVVGEVDAVGLWDCG